MYIYSLSCPDTNLIYYVGKTNDIKSRLYQHLYESKTTTNDNKKQAWITGLIKNGTPPLIEILDTVKQGDDSKEMENFYITYLRGLGFPLTNSSRSALKGLKTVSDTFSKTINFPIPLKKRIEKLAIKKNWSFHKTVLIMLNEIVK